MYQNKYCVLKTTNFYQDSLEVYGLACLLDKILNHNKVDNLSVVTMRDLGHYYEVLTEEVISEEMVLSLPFEVGFKYVFQEISKGTLKPKDLPDALIFDLQKEWDIAKNFDPKAIDESQKKPDSNLNLNSLLSHFAIEVSKENNAGTKQTGMFTRTYLQMFYNQTYFYDFVKGILHLYHTMEGNTEDSLDSIAFQHYKSEKQKYFVLSNDHDVRKTTYSSLLHPNMSKGINSAKQKLSEPSKEKEPLFLKEYIKLLGVFEAMFSIGGNQKMDDYRVYVCNPKNIDLRLQKQVINKFKQIFYANSAIKGDIYAILKFSLLLMEHLEKEGDSMFDFDWNPNNYVQGFYVCHFMTTKKSPPKKHSPINLAYLSLPNFMKLKDKTSVEDWKNITEELLGITTSIKGKGKDKGTNEFKDEDGDTVAGLNLLRSFLSSSRISFFLDFSYWYAIYLMGAFERKNGNKEKIYPKPFNEEILNIFYNNMNNNQLKLDEIIKSDGFLAVAKAIRNSTVNLQYVPKENRKFEVRYGLAQQLQNKSKSREDFVSFLGEFITTYNAETAGYVEKMLKEGKTPKNAPRAILKEEDIADFYAVFHEYIEEEQTNQAIRVRTFGALLASYGFSRSKKEMSKEQILKELAHELGYQLVKIETNLEEHAVESSEENE